MPAPYFLTTAIDYVNGAPHLGHAYEKVLADFFARYRRSAGAEVLFLTGVDEHGQKVQQSAQKQGVEPQAFCDALSAQFRALHEQLGVASTRFVRTTDPAHQAVVRDWLQQLYDRGEIFLAEHTGSYSVRQEQFLTERDKVDGAWPEIFGEVIETSEANYYFRLEPYRAHLLAHLEAHPDFIVPDFRRKELLSALEKPLDDLCISRPRRRLAWGIPLPFDAEYVTYVWFDALVNYYSFATLAGAPVWPPDLQIIGKDILIPAHGVYWPIMLLALGLELPRHLLVHGFWTSSGTKISKSDAKSLVDPLPYIEKFGPDPLRYFFLREMTLGQDADFSDARFETRYQTDLGNDLGNLVNRVLAMIVRYRQGVVPAYAEAAVTVVESRLRDDAVIAEFRAAVEADAPHLALAALWKLVGAANQYVEETAPFRLAKDPAQAGRLDMVLGHLAETVRRLAILLEPALPFTAQKIGAQLRSGGATPRLVDAAFGQTLAGHEIGAPQPLFPRLDLPVVR